MVVGYTVVRLLSVLIRNYSAEIIYSANHSHSVFFINSRIKWRQNAIRPLAADRSSNVKRSGSVLFQTNVRPITGWIVSKIHRPRQTQRSIGAGPLWSTRWSTYIKYYWLLCRCKHSNLSRKETSVFNSKQQDDLLYTCICWRCHYGRRAAHMAPVNNETFSGTIVIQCTWFDCPMNTSNHCTLYKSMREGERQIYSPW